MFVLMTWNEYYRHYLQQLQSIYTREEAAAITALIIENKTGVTRTDIITWPGKAVSGEHQSMLDEALEQLLTHKPVQQITGDTWFYDLRFAVNEHVLVPRPETEELVKWILEENAGGISILDIGSGSGCIPVVLKRNLQNADVTSIDISKEALLLANKNATANKADVHFMLLDFLNKEEWEQLSRYDVIVSNPPYIPAAEKENVGINVTAYEPHSALFVPDERPLLFYEQIIVFAKTHLEKEGRIYVEIHEEYGTATASLFLEAFKQVEIRKDINGKDRMIRATHFL